MLSRRIFVCLALAFLPALHASAVAQFDPDPWIPDTVRLGCPIIVEDIVPGDSFKIPVYIWHDEQLGGFGIGFEYNYDYVVFESIDFLESVFDATQQAFINIAFKPESRQVYVGFAPFSIPLYEQPSEADTGSLLFSFNMKVVAGASPAWIDLDSTFASPAGNFLLSVDADSTAGININAITPQFVDCGALDVGLGMGLFLCGDVDGNGGLNIADAVYLIGYIFGSTPAPTPLESGDVDCSGGINMSDVVYLIAYIFGSGPPPCDPNGDTVPDC